MIGQRRTLVAVAAALLLTSTARAQQPPTKFVAPVKGVAQIEYLAPQVKADGKSMIVTTIKVKNISSGAIAGFKVDEFWYDKKGQPVTGSQTFRHPKPLLPGETVDVILRVPRVEGMATNSYLFAHANGTIKPTKVTKFTEKKPST